NSYTWLGRSGPMARTVEDLSLFMRVSAGPSRLPNPSPLTGDDFGTPVPDLHGVRIGYSFDFGLGMPVEAEVIDTLGKQLQVFEDAGAHLEEATIDFS